MKLRAGLLTAVVVLLRLTFAKEPNSDITISITGIEHRQRTTTDSDYQVEGKTISSVPIIRYKLSCKNGAADLEVGHRYNATEATENGLKTLFISYRVERDPTIIGVICEIDSEKVVEAEKEK
jgi:hypothetical protein